MKQSLYGFTFSVIPVKTGIQNRIWEKNLLDTRFRGYDGTVGFVLLFGSYSPRSHFAYFRFASRILEKIKNMESPLKRQLLLVGLITKLLEEKGKEEAPVEIVELEEGLHCTIIGIEDLILDRMNACKRWGSEIDCE